MADGMIIILGLVGVLCGRGLSILDGWSAGDDSSRTGQGRNSGWSKRLKEGLWSFSRY